MLWFICMKKITFLLYTVGFHVCSTPYPLITDRDVCDTYILYSVKVQQWKSLMNLTNDYKVFPTKLFYLNVSPMTPTMNLSKFCSSKYHVGLIRQSFTLSNFCAIQITHTYSNAYLNINFHH